MSSYVFIESRDPFESGDARFVADTAAALKQRGEQVTVFLVQNGVLGARARARGSNISQLADAGVAGGRLLVARARYRERPPGVRGERIINRFASRPNRQGKHQRNLALKT